MNDPRTVLSEQDVYVRYTVENLVELTYRQEWIYVITTCLHCPVKIHNLRYDFKFTI